MLVIAKAHRQNSHHHSHSGQIMRIALLVYPNLLATSLTMPAEMLAAAREQALLRDRRTPPLQLLFVSAIAGNYASRSGLPIAADNLPTDDELDLILLPGMWRNPLPVLSEHAGLLPWLSHHAQRGCVIGAVGTGVYLLAEAGLLNGKPATTHWFYLRQLQQRYPQVDVKSQYLITRAGNLYCAASINAIADLTVHLVRDFYGAAVAAHVERHFSQEARKAYEHIAYAEESHERHHDEDIIRVQLWLRQHHAQTIQLADVACQFGMSLRNFNRRFKQACGISPLSYLQQVRMDNARDLLASSNLAVHEVADKIGYSDTSHFSRLFKQTFTMTPSEYRQTIRTKVFSVTTPPRHKP